MISTLVGGYWYEHTRAGLWCSTSGNSSDVSRTHVGARPLILNIGIWCVCFVVYDCLLLSAVYGLIILDVACGIGITATHLL